MSASSEPFSRHVHLFLFHFHKYCLNMHEMHTHEEGVERYSGETRLAHFHSIVVTILGRLDRLSASRHAHSPRCQLLLARRGARRIAALTTHAHGSFNLIPQGCQEVPRSIISLSRISIVMENLYLIFSCEQQSSSTALVFRDPDLWRGLAVICAGISKLWRSGN